MNKRIILTAAIYGCLAVIFGAFGAHALKVRIHSDELATWNTGVQYHFYHTFALLFLATFARFKNNIINFASYCFNVGIILFSGSLYLIATESLFGVNFSTFLGPITPIGGVLFILGWISLFLAALRDK